MVAEGTKERRKQGKQDIIVLYSPNDVNKLFCLHLILLYPPSKLWISFVIVC